ncbi:MAG: cytochrome C peroxidase [Bacteroidetes bacterium]|nr:MAG: cytochrome C peroxidase [Bacteroidota bacterium]
MITWNKTLRFVWLGSLLLLSACGEDDNPPACPECDDPLIEGDYDPTTYELQVPSWLPTPIIPADNPMTEEGVALGRMLFYDPILSADSTQSCFSCHRQELAFTDGAPRSFGILGIPTRRSSMALINLSLLDGDLFWDGRSPSLEDQALQPIEAHDELNDSWENVEAKLRRHRDYPALFRAAFGIERRSEITRELAVKAIAQFERTLISANSKYDRVVWQLADEFTLQEERGYELFKIEPDPSISHPGCAHCHFEPNFTNNKFINNGLDDVDDLQDFNDRGRGEVTNVLFDNGKFRVPTLRNIALTAPYMHDGRLQTLEEVIDHYARGGHGVVNEDVNLLPFELSEEDKAALIAFLHTLTDTTFLQNPAFSSPF